MSLNMMWFLPEYKMTGAKIQMLSCIPLVFPETLEAVPGGRMSQFGISENSSKSDAGNVAKTGG